MKVVIVGTNHAGIAAANTLLDNYPDAAPGAPLRPYEALVLER